MNAFDVLMVLTLGSLAGTGIGLALGVMVKKRGFTASMISMNEAPLNLLLVIVCSCISIACLAWISLA